jgi:hypothetical protein
VSDSSRVRLSAGARPFTSRPRAEQLQFMRMLVTLLEAHGNMPKSGSAAD